MGVSDAKLKEAVQDIAYEIRMFRKAFEKLNVKPMTMTHTCSEEIRLTYPVPRIVPPASDFLTLEVFLLHFRNLLEFLYMEDSSSNVLAAHYVGSWNPRGKQPSWGKDDKQRCNRLLSHLTYDRIALRKQNLHIWPALWDRYEHLQRHILEFLSLLTPDRREWFREHGV
jgi:hypothetical protein